MPPSSTYFRRHCIAFTVNNPTQAFAPQLCAADKITFICHATCQHSGKVYGYARCVDAHRWTWWLEKLGQKDTGNFRLDLEAGDKYDRAYYAGRGVVVQMGEFQPQGARNDLLAGAGEQGEPSRQDELAKTKKALDDAKATIRRASAAAVGQRTSQKAAMQRIKKLEAEMAAQEKELVCCKALLKARPRPSSIDTERTDARRRKMPRTSGMVPAASASDNNRGKDTTKPYTAQLQSTAPPAPVLQAGQGTSVCIYIFLPSPNFGGIPVSAGTARVVCGAHQTLGTLLSDGTLPAGTWFSDMDKNALDLAHSVFDDNLKPALLSICAYLPAGDCVLSMDRYMTHWGVTALQSTRFFSAKLGVRIGEAVAATGAGYAYTHVTAPGVSGSRAIPPSRVLRNLVSAGTRFVRLEVHLPAAGSIAVEVDVKRTEGTKTAKTLRFGLATDTPVEALVTLYKVAPRGSLVQLESGSMVSAGTRLRDLAVSQQDGAVRLVVLPPGDATDSDSEDDA